MNTIDNYFVQFVGDELIVSGKHIPLGQITTEVLNWDDAPFEELRIRVEEFSFASDMFFNLKSKSVAIELQEKLNSVLEIILTLPPYRDLDMDSDLLHNFFIYLSHDEEQWQEAMTERTMGHELVRGFVKKINELPEQLIEFRRQVSYMLDKYFEDLHSRTKKDYGAAFNRYYRDRSSTGFMPYAGVPFEQSFPAHVSFVPLETEDGIVVAEEMNFGELPAFFYTDFYRGMIHGNLPRRCHNCGRYFLLTSGYDIRYCSNIAPGETEKTCRKVGAHVKEQQKHEAMAKTPEGREYNRTYRRLQGRMRGGKITRDEWNAQVAEAQELLDKAQRGELSEQELQSAFNAIGGDKRKWTKREESEA